MTKRYEQETIITRAADEAHWQVYTCDGVMKRRMERLAREQGLEVRRVDRYGIEVEVPKDWLENQASSGGFRTGTGATQAPSQDAGPRCP